MHDENQAPPGDRGASPPHHDAPPEPPVSSDVTRESDETRSDATAASEPPTEHPAWPPTGRSPFDSTTGAEPPLAAGQGLATWLLVLLVCGVGGILLGMQELAGLAAVAGLFVAAQAADVDRRWESLHYLLTWVIPVGGAVLGCGIAIAIFRSDMTGPLRTFLVGMSLGAGVIALLTLLRPISDPLARVMFRGAEPSHTLRFAARLILLIFMLSIPGWFAFHDVLGTVFEDPSTLLDRVSLGGELLGYVLVAFAAVGFMVRRDLRASLERLGIRSIPVAHIAMIAIGVVALWGMNSGADWTERTFFHDLWLRDQQFNESLAAHLSPARVLLLGLSAGIGEEITMRGALQPKFGMAPTSLLFGALHVQYSWFGILVICVLGLTLGLIRARASTSAAMAVHVIYDVLAVFSV